MKQEEKELLFKDLCARLLYGINAVYYGGMFEPQDVRITKIEDDGIVFYVNENKPNNYGYISIEYVKPYIRPMESMTEEEKEQTRDLWIDADIKTHATRLIDFYNKHHLDYRGLIPMGLALPAPKRTYN